MSVFDPNTGQVYTEESAPVTSMKHNWHWKTKGRRPNPSNSSLGAARLEDMCIHVILMNLEDLRSDHFQHIEWTVAGKIWVAILRNKLNSFMIWRAFAGAYRNPPPAPLRLHVQKISQRSKTIGPFESMYPMLNSLDFDCMTKLTLHRADLTRAEYASIHKIKNLTALRLSSCTVHKPWAANVNYPMAELLDVFERQGREECFPKLRIVEVITGFVQLAAAYRCFSQFLNISFIGLGTGNKIPVDAEFCPFVLRELTKDGEIKGVQHEKDGWDALPRFVNPATQNTFSSNFPPGHAVLDMRYGHFDASDHPHRDRVTDPTELDMGLKWFQRITAAIAEPPLDKSDREETKEPARKKVRRSKQEDVGDMLNAYN